MAFVISCQHCDQQFKVRESFVGRRFRCKACKKVNEIADVEVEAPEKIPRRPSEDEIPVSTFLPPVARSISTKAKAKQEAEEKEADDHDYELLTGRAGVLGEFDEEEYEENRKTIMQIGGGFALILLLMVGGSIVYNRMNNTPDKLVPKEFEEYDFKQAQLLVDVPVDWEVKSGGGGNIPEFLTLKNNKVLFTMRANFRGTLDGGVADAFSSIVADGGQPADDAEPVHAAHMSMGNMIKNEYVGYEEEPPKTIRPTPFGSARISRFSGRNQFGMTEQGFRATIKTDFYAYRILITMPAWLMDDFEPAAKEIIASIRPNVEDDFGFDDEDDDDMADEPPAEEDFEVDPFTGEKIPREPAEAE